AMMYAFSGVSSGEEIIRFNFQADIITNARSFIDCLYFSVVTFTTLGYGDIVPLGLTRLFAASEAFIGGFAMALFVVIVAKKTSR
ncbi:MAG: potassium channel family protein, partial [Gammaproteobacteria bacterium]|nr:potassium channel family protein [Gammaproteobacteria bacterium]